MQPARGEALGSDPAQLFLACPTDPRLLQEQQVMAWLCLTGGPAAKARGAGLGLLPWTGEETGHHRGTADHPTARLASGNSPTLLRGCIHTKIKLDRRMHSPSSLPPPNPFRVSNNVQIPTQHPPALCTVLKHCQAPGLGKQLPPTRPTLFSVC